MMPPHRACFFVAAALALARPAAAEEPQAPGVPASESLTLGEEGLQRFQGGHWKGAYELFRRANDAAHAPTLLLYMAHCQARLGDLGAARQLYRAVTREHLAEGAPLQFRTAQRIAAQELRSIEPRIAPVKLEIAGASEGPARVLVDGVEVPSAQIEDLALEPGDHVVEASLPGGATLRRAVTAVAGRPVRITLVFDAAPSALARRVVPPAPEVPVAPEHPGSRLLVGAGIAFGTGGVSLAAGLVAGVISLDTAAGVKSRCLPGGHCLVSDQANAASAGQLADASTGTIVMGAVAVAAGVVLAVMHAHAPASAATTGVHVLPGRAFLAGVF
jgi:hypothetical protein